MLRAVAGTDFETHKAFFKKETESKDMTDSPNSNFRNGGTLSELDEKRLWKHFDNLFERLSSIEYQLSDIIRLQERVDNHGEVLERFGARIDSHEERIRENELWQARQGERASLERRMASLADTVDALQNGIHNVDKTQSRNLGQKDVSGQIAKWVAGIFAAWIVFNLTNNKANAEEPIVNAIPVREVHVEYKRENHGDDR